MVTFMYDSNIFWLQADPTQLSSINLTIPDQDSRTDDESAIIVNDDIPTEDIESSTLASLTTDPQLPDIPLSAEFTTLERPTLCAKSNISYLNAFRKLRAKKVEEIVEDPIMLPSSSSPVTPSSNFEEITAITKDRSIIILPSDRYIPAFPHQYMVSMEFVQRQNIIRELRKLDIDLVERTSLGGIELIVDPLSATIVSSLFTLPSVGKLLADRIADNSWRFQNILVLLEGYPEVLSFRPPKSKLDVPDLFAFTPPILKAIKKLRRDVAIAEAYGKKNSGCCINYSFARDVSEAGKLVRYFGDLAQERDQTGGILWRQRDWLSEEELLVSRVYLYQATLAR